MLAVGIGGVRGQFDAWRRDWTSSWPVRSYKYGLQEFEPSSKLGVVIGGVRAQFESWSSDWRSSRPVRGLE